MSIFNPSGMNTRDIEAFIKKSLKSKKEEGLKKVFKSDKVISLLLKDDYTPIQLLIFHYLDFLNQYDMTNEKKKVLLSIIFKTEGFENIRKRLSKMSELMTDENLEILQDLFFELNLEQPLIKVRKDLAKPISKRR